MTPYQQAIKCREEFNKAWAGEVPEEIIKLFAAIVEKAEKENVFDINMKTSYGDGLLHLIVVTSRDQSKAITILLANGADINLAAHDGRTPLLRAVDKFSMNNNWYNYVSVLIGIGADINKGDKKGDTPLHHVVMLMDYGSNHSRSLLLPLLEKGAIVARQNKEGHNAYDCLQDKIEDNPQAGEIEELKKCLAILNTFFEKEKTLATQRATEFEKAFRTKWKGEKNKLCNNLLADVVYEAKEEGIFNVNIMGIKGIALLHYAAACLELDVLQLLIDHGADVNSQTTYQDPNYVRKGWTALHCILSTNNYEKFSQRLVDTIDEDRRLCILLLLKHDAKITIPDRDGCTVLNAAIASKQHDNGLLYNLLIAGLNNPYERNKLIGLQNKIYQAPSLSEICFFITKKMLSRSEIEAKKNIIPQEIYFLLRK